MKNLRIRELKACDLLDLARLYKQFWQEDSSLELMLHTFEAVRQDPRYVFLVAESQGRLAGTVRGVVCSALYGDCRPFMVVDDVIVDAGCRRQGVGRLLMQHLEKHATARDCAFITFVTETSRTGAQQFYASLGYDPDTYVGFKKRL